MNTVESNIQYKNYEVMFIRKRRNIPFMGVSRYAGIIPNEAL